MKGNYSLQRYVVKENFPPTLLFITSDRGTVSEKKEEQTKPQDICSFSMTPKPEQSDVGEFHDIELVHNRAASKHVPNKNQDPTIVVAFQGLKKVRRVGGREGGCLSL
jgi:hypothetical protein